MAKAKRRLLSQIKQRSKKLLHLFFPLSNYFAWFFSFLISESCLLCNSITEDIPVCSKCVTNFVKIQDNGCQKCGYPLHDNTFLSNANQIICHECSTRKHFFDKAISVFEYNNYIKQVILNFKYYHNTQVVKFISLSILNKVQKHYKNIDIICIVPSSRLKVIQKGFSHTGLIGMHLHRMLPEIVYLPDLLIQTKYQISQTKLNYNQRIDKKHCIVVNKKYINLIYRKNILIIDDIITTGSTIEHCAKTLKDISKCNVYAASFARTMLY